MKETKKDRKLNSLYMLDWQKPKELLKPIVKGAKKQHR